MATIRKRKLPSGKIAWQCDFRDISGKRRSKQFAKRRDSDTFLVKARAQILDGLFRPEASTVTVSEICEYFFEYCEGRNRRNERMTRHMLAVYRGHITNHILHPEHGIGRIKLTQLTARVIGDFRDCSREGGVTVPTMRKILATVHTILQYAILQDFVAINAAHGIKVIGPRDEGPKKVLPPSKEDLQKVLEAASEDFKLKIRFAATTGLRAGKQWAVRWRNLDLDSGGLHVLLRVDVYGEEGPPKSLAGVRTIPLSEHLVTALKQWRLRSKFSKQEDLVFPNQNGTHTCHGNIIKREFNKIFRYLNEAYEKDPESTPEPPTRFNWHGLRHFAVSTWIEAGLTPKTAQTFAGHSSLQITMDRYGHLFKSDNHKRAMDEIGEGVFA